MISASALAGESPDPQGLSATDVAARGRETDPCREARRLDPRREQDLWPDVPLGYRVPSGCGVQFAQGCLSIANDQGVGRRAAERKLTSWVRSAVSLVLDSCATRYPQLIPYLKEFATHLRRTVIACTAKTSKDIDAGAMNLYVPASMEHVLSASERQGIDPGLAPWASTSRNYRSIVVLPSDTLKKILSSADTFDPGVTDTLVHEILHSTTANNLHDHNEVELRAAGGKGCTHKEVRQGKCSIDLEGKSCAQNIVADRICTVSALCTGSTALYQGRRIEDLLAARAATCGLEAGCVQIFTSSIDYPLERHYMPSKPLRRAKTLCERIVDQSFCRKFIDEHEVVLARTHPVISKVAARVVEKVKPLLMRATNDVPKALLNAFPGEKKGLESLQATSCFKAFMRFGEDGSLYFHRLAERKSLAALSDRERGDFRSDLWHDRFARTRGAISESRSGLCGPQEKKALTDILERIEHGAQKLFSSQAYALLVERRLQGQAELFWGADSHRRPSFATLEDELRFRDVIGDELYDEYLAVLDRHHPSSKHFDCAANGIGFGKKFRDFQRAIQMKPNTPAYRTRRLGVDPAEGQTGTGPGEASPSPTDGLGSEAAE